MTAVAGACAAVAALGLVCLMVLTVADVVRRALVGRSIDGAVELAPLILLGAVVLGLGHGEVTGAHVRTTLVTGRLPERPRAAVRAVGYAICVVILIWVTKASFDRAVDAYDFNDTTAGFKSIPTWPVRALVPVGFALFALALALRLVDDLRALRGDRRLIAEVKPPTDPRQELGERPEARG